MLELERVIDHASGWWWLTFMRKSLWKIMQCYCLDCLWRLHQASWVTFTKI